MTKITLHANEFKYEGVHNKREYNKLRIKSFGNGRVYLTYIKDQFPYGEMAKQMQLENGIVYLTFGKKGKIEIGTYTEE